VAAVGASSQHHLHQSPNGGGGGGLFGARDAGAGSTSSLLASSSPAGSVSSPFVGKKKDENIKKSMGLGGRMLNYKVTSGSSTSLPESTATGCGGVGGAEKVPVNATGFLGGGSSAVPAGPQHVILGSNLQLIPYYRVR
jgi:hypothetical protein